MNYEEAKALARSGKAVIMANTNGHRYVWFEQSGETVTATLMGSVVARFRPGGVELDRCGYDTATTREVIGRLIPGGSLYCERKGVWTYHRYLPDGRTEDIPFRDGMTVRYSERDFPFRDFYGQTLAELTS